MKPSSTDTGAPDGLHRRRLRHAQAEIRYRTGGAGPAVVLIPSLGRGSEDFDLLVPALLRAGLRLILPEPRGIEGSTPLSDSATLHDMAADIAAIIEAEGAAPAVLIGHAAGNWVARVLAWDRPDLTRAVALLAAIVTNVVPEAVKSSITASFDMSLPDAERLTHLRRVYFAAGSDASVWLDGWWPEVAAQQRQAAQRTPGKDWMRAADRHPVLYLAAAEDVISPPPELGQLRETIGPKADCVTIEGAGHALLPEQPEGVALALAAWIAGLAERGA